MQFGCSTLGDNASSNDPRNPNRFVVDIVVKALAAEQLGFDSARIGEHRFSTVGVVPCPDPAPAYIAARTHRIRLAPAVTVLPPHHPIRLAEQWASLDLLSVGRAHFATVRGFDWCALNRSASTSIKIRPSSRKAWMSSGRCTPTRRRTAIRARSIG
jgi:hypothetical protein